MKLMNVWISDIIEEELRKKYVLESEDVYIMPIGKTMSKKTGYYYNDFVILQDKEVQDTVF